MDDDHTYMMAALEEAKKAAKRDEVPIGAVCVDFESGKILSRAGNRTREMNDPSAHAEILAIRQACEIKGAQRIPECDLYITLEPCTMCAAAISFARIRRVIIGAMDKKGGGVLHGAKFYAQPTCHNRPDVINGIMEKECANILREFFKLRR